MPAPAGGRARADGLLGVVLTVAAVVAGTALLGLAAGFVWAAVAPRTLLVMVGHGSADVVHPETSAFIVDDAWFVLLSVIGGGISGALGYRLAVRRHGASAMAGVLAGALAAALIARWAGQQPGAATFNHLLAVSKPGVYLRPPVMLGAVGALAFWPLAAGLTAGGFEAASYVRERRQMLGPQLAGPPPSRPGLSAWIPPFAPGTSPDPHPAGGPAGPGGPAGVNEPAEATGQHGPLGQRGPADPGSAP